MKLHASLSPRSKLAHENDRTQSRPSFKCLKSHRGNSKPQNTGKIIVSSHIVKRSKTSLRQSRREVSSWMLQTDSKFRYFFERVNFCSQLRVFEVMMSPSMRAIVTLKSFLPRNGHTQKKLLAFKVILHQQSRKVNVWGASSEGRLKGHCSPCPSIVDLSSNFQLTFLCLLVALFTVCLYKNKIIHCLKNCLPVN